MEQQQEQYTALRNKQHWRKGVQEKSSKGEKYYGKGAQGKRSTEEKDHGKKGVQGNKERIVEGLRV